MCESELEKPSFLPCGLCLLDDPRYCRNANGNENPPNYPVHMSIDAPEVPVLPRHPRVREMQVDKRRQQIKAVPEGVICLGSVTLPSRYRVLAAPEYKS